MLSLVSAGAACGSYVSVFHGALLELHVRAWQCDRAPGALGTHQSKTSPTAQLLSHASSGPRSPTAHHGHSGAVLPALPLPSVWSSPAGPAPSPQHSRSAWGAHCNYFPVPALPLGVTALMSWWRSCQPPPRRFATTGSCLHMWSNYRARRRMLAPSANVIPPSPGADSLLCTSVGQRGCPWAGGLQRLSALQTNLSFLMDEMTASRPTSISFKALSSRGRLFCNGARFALGLEKGFLAAP